MSEASEQLLLARQLARRIFSQADTLVVSKAPEGASTWVYRVVCDQMTYYLRVLPEENASFAPEVYVHNALRTRGLHVPEIVYFEEHNEAFQRSVVVTSAIKGNPIERGASPERFAPVLREAGRELALLNQMAGEGFGWIARDWAKRGGVFGGDPAFGVWMTVEIEAALLAFARRGHFDASQAALLARILSQAIEHVGSDSATLAHGDFDATHIFHY